MYYCVEQYFSIHFFCCSSTHPNWKNKSNLCLNEKWENLTGFLCFLKNKKTIKKELVFKRLVLWFTGRNLKDGQITISWKGGLRRRFLKNLEKGTKNLQKLSSARVSKWLTPLKLSSKIPRPLLPTFYSAPQNPSSPSIHDRLPCQLLYNVIF